MPKKEENKAFAKETFFEFLRSLITGVFPTLTDLIFSNLILYIFFAKGEGYTYFKLLFETIKAPGDVSAAATAIGYGLGSIVTYICSVLFVFKNTKKAKTLKGVLLFICVEGFAYGLNVFLGWAFASIPIYFLAFATRIVVSYVIVFTLRKLLIFMPEKKKAEEASSDEASALAEGDAAEGDGEGKVTTYNENNIDAAAQGGVSLPFVADDEGEDER